MSPKLGTSKALVTFKAKVENVLWFVNLFTFLQGAIVENKERGVGEEERIIIIDLTSKF